MIGLARKKSLTERQHKEIRSASLLRTIIDEQKMLEVEQNIFLCIVLSAVGGILEVFATAALAYPDAKKKEGKEYSSLLLRSCLVANIVLQITASMVGNLLAPWFGPVSIVGPTFLSAQLLANMVLYGWVLGLECFTKDMKIGTAVIVTAAILLPVVGPQVQENQDATSLMSMPYAHVWNGILIFGMLASGVILSLYKLGWGGRFCKLHSKAARYAVLLVARATSFSVNLSYSKVFALKPTTVWFVVSIILKVLSGAVMTGSIVIQSTAVEQNAFVPLNATTVILVNAITGIIIWEDWRSMSSWLGYVTVFIQLIVGNYLLLGEVDLFGPQNKRYGRRLMLKRIAGNKILHVSPSTSLVDSDECDYIGDEQMEEGFANDDEKETAEDLKGKSKETALDESPPISPRPGKLERGDDLMSSSIEVTDEVASAWLSSPWNDSATSLDKKETTPEPHAGGEDVISALPTLPSKPTRLGKRAQTSCATPGGGLSKASPSSRNLIPHTRPPKGSALASPSPTSLPQRAQTTGGMGRRRKSHGQQHRRQNSRDNNFLHVHLPHIFQHELTAEEAAAAEAKHRAWEGVFGVSDSYLERRGARLSLRRGTTMTPIVEDDRKPSADDIIEEGDEQESSAAESKSENDSPV